MRTRLRELGLQHVAGKGLNRGDRKIRRSRRHHLLAIRVTISRFLREARVFGWFAPKVRSQPSKFLAIERQGADHIA